MPPAASLDGGITCRIGRLPCVHLVDVRLTEMTSSIGLRGAVCRS